MISLTTAFYIILYIRCGENNHDDFYYYQYDGTLDAECILGFEFSSQETEVFINSDEYEDYLNFVDGIKLSIIQNNYVSKNHDYLANGRFEEYVNELDTKIREYIKHYLYEGQHRVYFLRLDRIKHILEKFSKYESEDVNIFTPDIEKDFTHVLNSLRVKYNNLFSFNNKIYDLFSNDLDVMIIKLKNDYYLKYKTLQRNIENGNDILFSSFMKIYKYVKEFPELLCLGSILTQNCTEKLTISLYLLTLFLDQYETNLRENKVVVMFLLKKIFNNTKKTQLDIFYTFQMQEKNLGDYFKLGFFSWEFDNNQRGKIKKRINYYNNPSLCLDEGERVHYNIVLRLFLFQHLLFLKFKNVDNSEFEKFKALTNEILTERECYSVQFYKFLHMINV